MELLAIENAREMRFTFAATPAERVFGSQTGARRAIFTARVSDLKAIPVGVNWCSDVSVYASEGFLKSESSQYGWIGGVEEQGRLRCILPFTVTQKFGFRMVRFRTETIPCEGALEIEEERLFLRGVVNHFRASGADFILPSGNTAIFRTHPDGASAAPYGSVVNDLTQGEESLWRGIRKTYRQMIRKAEAEGVEIRCGAEHLDAAYKLVSDTMKRSGAAFMPYERFKHRIIALGENVKIFVAEKSGRLEGCMVAPFSQYAAYNCYAGSKPQPVLGAMHRLHWEAMRHFRALGVKRFDFQGIRIDPEKGSKQDGIACYKRGFGGAVVRGYTWKYSLRPLKSAVYSLAARLLLGGDLVDQERRRLAGKVESVPAC